jgi:fatty-acid desaturase|tara:strand:+ start:2451 stop:3209 length:759 start_codon:yes stop_codon:yes gene_type:complete
MNASLDKVRYLFILNLSLIVILSPFVDFTFPALLLVLAMYFIYDCLGIVITNHRYWTHKSFKFKNKVLKYVFSAFAVLSGTGSSLGWAGIHRIHHEHSDNKEQDPHDTSRGFMGMLFLRYSLNEMKMIRQALPLTRDPYIKYTNRYWLLIIAAYVSLLTLLGGVQSLYFAFIIPSVLVMFVQALTNYINHIDIGYRNHTTKDNSHNCIWLSLLNWGEGFHNNHHANPAKSNLREKWWEIDISGMIIDIIKAK